MSIGAGEAHILNLCVARGCAAAASARGCSRICSSARAAAADGEAFLEVRPSNTAAIRLYQAFGFEHVGMRRGYYQAPAAARTPPSSSSRCDAPAAPAG